MRGEVNDKIAKIVINNIERVILAIIYALEYPS
jgi:hypothetical protein